jgi:hypothetical protein
MENWTGCIAGALTREDFRRELANSGFDAIEIEETHRVHRHAGSAIARAREAGGRLGASQVELPLTQAKSPRSSTG